jgi:hypothetical protein
MCVTEEWLDQILIGWREVMNTEVNSSNFHRLE